jgi:hypothetical protein
MNSTLLVFITSLIIESGEPYMMTENMEAAKPQKTFLGVPCRAKRDTKTTIENTESTAVKRPKILSFSFLGANMMNIKTYMISIAAPAPFTVDTSKLWGDTKGKPYQAERRQLSSVITYGMPENFSVDLFTIILLNVITGAKKRNRAEAFPHIPSKKCAISMMLNI